ncbi:hypothetical protein R2F25_37705 [Streptomyces sp. UP1A-1]|nr:hypothetical protein [Streptomyces sp. UP1A-1]
MTVSVIDGMAGIGKTALAVHAGHRLDERYPDGRLFVDLQAHTAGRAPMDAGSALGVLLRQLGIPAEQIPVSVAERAGLWRAELARPPGTGGARQRGRHRPRTAVPARGDPQSAAGHQPRDG